MLSDFLRIRDFMQVFNEIILILSEIMRFYSDFEGNDANLSGFKQIYAECSAFHMFSMK